jgi:hypothetical protein
VLVALSDPVGSLPDVGLLPLHAPDAVHDVTFEDDQVSVAVWFAVTEAGFADSVTFGVVLEPPLPPPPPPPPQAVSSRRRVSSVTAPATRFSVCVRARDVVTVFRLFTATKSFMGSSLDCHSPQSARVSPCMRIHVTCAVMPLSGVPELRKDEHGL